MDIVVPFLIPDPDKDAASKQAYDNVLDTLVRELPLPALDKLQSAMFDYTFDKLATPRDDDNAFNDEDRSLLSSLYILTDIVHSRLLEALQKAKDFGIEPDNSAQIDFYTEKLTKVLEQKSLLENTDTSSYFFHIAKIIREKRDVLGEQSHTLPNEYFGALLEEDMKNRFVEWPFPSERE